jgi:hypothetical protein
MDGFAKFGEADSILHEPRIPSKWNFVPSSHSYVQ